MTNIWVFEAVPRVIHVTCLSTKISIVHRNITSPTVMLGVDGNMRQLAQISGFTLKAGGCIDSSWLVGNSLFFLATFLNFFLTLFVR